MGLAQEGGTVWDRTLAFQNPAMIHLLCLMSVFSDLAPNKFLITLKQIPLDFSLYPSFFSGLFLYSPHPSPIPDPSYSHPHLPIHLRCLFNFPSQGDSCIPLPALLVIKKLTLKNPPLKIEMIKMLLLLKQIL